MKKHTKYKLDTNEAYLSELGITNYDGSIKPKMTKKFKQISRFVELLSERIILTGISKQSKVKVLDIGAGRGYVTFATYKHLLDIGVTPIVDAVERRENLTTDGNKTAKICGFDGLTFYNLLAEDYTPEHYYDAVISLHACDTATDDALLIGMNKRSRIIISAPCCQKEVLPQVKNSKVLSKFIQNGLFLHKMADLITDNARVMLLQSQGYKVDVIDFVASEHSPKNTMLIATKRRGKQEKFYDQFKSYKKENGFKTFKLEDMMIQSKLIDAKWLDDAHQPISAH